MITEEDRKKKDIETQKEIENISFFSSRILDSRYWNDFLDCLKEAYGEKKAQEIYQKTIVKRWDKVSSKNQEIREKEFFERNQISISSLKNRK